MHVNQIPLTLNVRAPLIWAGRYVYLAGDVGGWSWYKDGNRNATCAYELFAGEGMRMNPAPHFTVSSASHESAPDGTWVGFHVSIPLRDAGKNARFNYAINGRLAKFKNTTRQGFSDDALTSVQDIARLAPLIDDFAQGVLTAALG